MLKVKVASQLLLVLVLIFALSGTTKAASLDELKSKKTTLQEEIRKKKEEEEKAKKAKEASREKKEEHQEEVVELNQAISQTTTEINDLEAEIFQTQEEIRIKEEEIAKLEAEIKELEAKIDEALRVIYEDGEKNALEIILKEKGISEIVSDAEAREALIDQILDFKRTAEEKKAELEKKKAELEEKKQSLEEKNQKLKILRQVQQAQRKEEDRLMQEAAKAEEVNKEKELAARSDAEKLKQEFSKVAAEEAMLRRLLELQRLGKLSPDERVSAVGFMWPVTGRITARIGERTPFQVHHTGLDIAGPIGTPIRASADGEIIAVTEMRSGNYFYGYGRYVTIKHNSVTATLYAHMNEAYVSPGQQIKRGDIIGTIGTTGWSTGPHVHFEIRLSGVPEDPLLYLP